MRFLIAFVFVSILLVSGCWNDNDNEKITDSKENLAQVALEEPATDYDQLRHKITYSQASLADVRTALTAKDKQTLTNIVHALYSMRWLRGAQDLLNDAWTLEKLKHPDLSWELLETPPVRLALASTINRIRIKDTDEYLAYIRAHKFDDDEFNRAQVVVALGFNGDPNDIDYLQSMANGNNHYVVQSAVTGLALMGGNQARDAMVALWQKHRDTSRGELILGLLDKSYGWHPPTQTDGNDTKQPDD